MYRRFSTSCVRQEGCVVSAIAEEALAKRGVAPQCQGRGVRSGVK
jgi:hypothetical protein